MMLVHATNMQLRRAVLCCHCVLLLCCLPSSHTALVLYAYCAHAVSYRSHCVGLRPCALLLCLLSCTMLGAVLCCAVQRTALRRAMYCSAAQHCTALHSVQNAALRCSGCAGLHCAVLCCMLRWQFGVLCFAALLVLLLPDQLLLLPANLCSVLRMQTCFKRLGP